MCIRDRAQAKQVEKFIEEKVDCILITAVDWKKICSSLEKAKKAGIPVIAVDALIYNRSFVDGTVVSNNYQDVYKRQAEALERRFSHGIREQKEREEKGQDMELGSFTRFPDILMMDGGKGQVNIALQVLEKLGLTIPVCGMVKDDFHRTRALYYNNEIIEFPKNSEAFRMITRLQDEAHRFAITYHKALRGKEQVQSVLDDIRCV